MDEQPTSQGNHESLRKHLDEIERHVMAVRQLMFANQKIAGREDLFKSPDGKIVEGVFDGESMVDQDGKIYPVSPNYASKSQLVVGDRLKLIIAPDGRFLYKQIGPVDRTHKVGTLVASGGQYFVDCGKKRYRILQASATYFKAKEGDRMTVVLPKGEDADWAAVENVIGEEGAGE